MKAYLNHIYSLLSRELNVLIGRLLPHIIQRSLNTGLHRIWARGDWQALPAGQFILAANHSSWWDAYLVWRIRQAVTPPFITMVREDTLATFPFFRQVGGVSSGDLRRTLRALQAGTPLFIFPQGEMQSVAPVADLQPGLTFLAQRASATVYPVAIRVVMRGAVKPEAFIVLGEAQARPFDIAHFQLELNRLLRHLDDMLLDLHPEAEPAGFTLWSSSTQRLDARLARWRRAWQR